MSTLTTNLSLIKPAIGDEIHQTIVDLSLNFQKIDDVSELYSTAMPTSGDWVAPKRVWRLVPVAGGQMGWVVIRSGKAAPAWITLTSYALDDLVLPTVNNGHYYKCVQAGKSGVVQPTFPVSSGAIIDDTQGATFWQATTSYGLNTVVKPNVSNDRFYVCTTAGTSGSTEPTWLTTEGSTTSDNGTIWTCHVITKWQEFGVSVLFKDFGLISS